MFASSVKYRKCAYAACFPLLSSQLFTGNGMSKNTDVRYIYEVDERLGEIVRLYAIVESSIQKIKAEMLIEQIRAQILPFDRTFGDYPINNIGNDAELANFLGAILSSIHRQCSQVCKGGEEKAPNIAVIIIRNRLILCGILGDMVFTLLRQNEDSYARRVDSQQYTLFSNCGVPLTLKENGTEATDKTPVNVYVHEIQSSDMRFFVFTIESIRMLLKATPSITLFTMSSDDIIWSLYVWQTEMYWQNPHEVPAVGFILVDKLSKLIADSNTRLEENFTEKLFKTTEKVEEQNQAKEIKQQKQKNRQAAQSNTSEKSVVSTSPHDSQTMLEQIQTKYTRITELINKLLHEEQDEMLVFIKHDKEIMNLEKECGEQMELKKKVKDLQQRQRKHLGELRIFLLKVLKYQDIVQCELLLNIEKVEQTSEIGMVETKAVIYSRETNYHHQRMRCITLFQTKIAQNLENLQKQMEETTRNGCKVQRKLDTLRSQIQKSKRWVRPKPQQTYWKADGAKQNSCAAINKSSNYGNGFQYHWRRQPNNGTSQNINCKKN
ncbi:hypothetical protein X798_03760 [Onchocerca flexuosa]|uniref:Protein kinase domain-containing protein n=2 Tax=Onchocerca flexuosa TaxID=387005 RepID=A0A183GYW0_9BILA|nr:hypothetical protein X798_03760 [Onchocerca flexuosa]VDO25727.1 unnamed protein product [Onchocerca flexuosa]